MLRHPWGKSGLLGEEILIFLSREVRLRTGLAAKRFAIAHFLQVIEPTGDTLVAIAVEGIEADRSVNVVPWGINPVAL